MATVVNTSSGGTDTGNSMATLFTMIMMVLLVLALLYFGLPALRGGFGTQAPSVTVPGKIDVNVNKK